MTIYVRHDFDSFGDARATYEDKLDGYRQMLADSDRPDADYIDEAWTLHAAPCEYTDLAGRALTRAYKERNQGR